MTLAERKDGALPLVPFMKIVGGGLGGGRFTHISTPFAFHGNQLCAALATQFGGMAG